MTQKLSGPMLMPLSGAAPRQAVVLLHGYGSDGDDLIAMAPRFAQALPDALFVAPNAPAPCDGAPFGYEWFPLQLDRAVSRLTGLPEARPVLEAFLSDLWAQTGLTAADTVLTGFSQGAMMALHVGYAIPETLLGVVAFSGGLVPPAELAAGTGGRPPACIVHGDLDDVVPPALSARAVEVLEAAGIEVTALVDRGVGHGVSPAGLAFAERFLEGRLAQWTAGANG